MKLNEFITMLLNTFKRKNNTLLLSEPNNDIILSEPNNDIIMSESNNDIIMSEPNNAIKKYKAKKNKPIHKAIQYHTITLDKLLQLCDKYAYNLIITRDPKIHQSFRFKVGFPTTKTGLNIMSYENYFLNIKKIVLEDDPRNNLDTYNEAITKLVIDIGTEVNNTILYRFEYTDDQRNVVIQTIKNYTKAMFNGEFDGKFKNNTTITINELKNAYNTEYKLTVNNLPSEEVINTSHDDILGLELLYQMLNSALYTYYKDIKENYYEMISERNTDDLYSNKQITIKKYVKLERRTQLTTITNPDTPDISSKDLKQQITYILNFYQDQSQQTQSLEQKEIMKIKHEHFLNIQNGYNLFVSDQNYTKELQELQALVNDELQKIQEIKESHAHHGILHEYNVLKTLLLEE